MAVLKQLKMVNHVCIYSAFRSFRLAEFMSEDAARIVSHFLEKVGDAGEVNFEKEVPFLENRLNLENKSTISSKNETKYDGEKDVNEYKSNEVSTEDSASQIFDFMEKKTETTAPSNRKLEIYNSNSKEEVSRIIDKIVKKSKKERLKADQRAKSKTSSVKSKGSFKNLKKTFLMNF